MKTIWDLDELVPYQNEPMPISGHIDLEEKLVDASQRIIAAEPTLIDGYFFYSPDLDEYQLSMQAQTDLVLPSTRSLKPVAYQQDIHINEIYLAPNRQELLENYENDDPVFLLEDYRIDISDILLENIILALPSQVLTDEEREGQEMPHGKDWQVLSEKDFEASQNKQRQEHSPFNQLKGLFDDEDA